MSQGNYDENKTMYGNFGTVFLDDSQVFEATGLQAKAKMNKIEVPMCGTMSKKYKTVGYDVTGTLTANKVNSRMIILIATKLKAGIEPAFTIISKMSDPATGGTERMKLTGVKFDELTLIDWSAGKLGTESTPFTAEEFEPLSTIDPSTT